MGGLSLGFIKPPGRLHVGGLYLQLLAQGHQLLLALGGLLHPVQQIKDGGVGQQQSATAGQYKPLAGFHAVEKLQKSRQRHQGGRRKDKVKNQLPGMQGLPPAPVKLPKGKGKAPFGAEAHRRSKNIIARIAIVPEF